MSEDRRPEWLPEEWTMRVSKRACGTIDRYYTSLMSGYTCRSKVEVMHHLNNEKNISCSTRSTSGFEDNKKQIIARVENSPDWLPSGWILDIKTRKKGAYAGRKYKCYIDPFSGSRFYSKGEVFRYLNSGVLHKHTFKQNRRIKRNSTKPPIAARNRILRGTTARRCLFLGQANVTTVIEIDEFPERSDLPPDSHPSAQRMEGANSSCMTPPEVEHLVKRIENLPDPAFGRDGIFPEPVSVKPLNEITLYPSQRKELDLVNEKLLVMEQQENVMLLQEKPPVPEDKLSEERQLELMNENLSHPAYRKPRRGPKKRRGAKKRGTGDPSSSQKPATGVRPGPRRIKAFKAITLPLRSSKRLAGIKADPVEQLPAKTPVQKSNQCGGSRRTSTRSDAPKSAPIINLELLEKLESKESSVEQVGARRLRDDLPQSSLILPFGNSWPDPCIEFAFKTLTGDIPVLENAAVIQDYFHQQLISAQSGSSTSSVFGGPEKFSQPELHVEQPLRDGRVCAFEKEVESGRKVNQDCHRGTRLNH